MPGISHSNFCSSAERHVHWDGGIDDIFLIDQNKFFSNCHIGHDELIIVLQHGSNSK